ncbi:MAG TPA: DUF5916 domain-containing protein [Longimicrobium sp.]|jgi:hypothetical protein|uniref:DUF5916 domain-containing protein n=1 Tax=Longimicrobium sp. TaxID=2029185 RepID=UPI002EDB96DE
MRRIHLTFLLLLVCAPAALAQVPADSTRAATRAVRAARVSGPVRVDGRLDEAAWAAAGVADAFTESYPTPRAPARERTEARILFDDQAVYVGVRMYDARPDSIAAQLARRDASGIYSDWVHVILDTYHDRRTGFRFSVNPRGVKKDVFHFDDTNEDLSWDAVWEVATLVDSAGWTAEYRIPLSQLRYGRREPAAGRVWGVQVQRDVARREERTSWSPWTQSEGGFVSRFGDLAGLDGLRTPRRLEIQPYTSARMDRAPGGDAANPFYRPNDLTASAGVDVKYGLPSGLTLTATVNPDFGQVEVDPAVVNLSAFEVQFPERRPFFTEGTDIFRFGHPTNSFNNYQFTQPFYSRRIGRRPQRTLSGRLGEDDVLFSDAPEQTTIAAAAKLSGRTRGGWSIGLLDAVTTRENGAFLGRRVVAGDTVLREGSAPVEPLSNYFAGRVRRDLRGGQSVAGAMVTAIHRDLGEPALGAMLRSSAYMGGVDFDHSWGNRTWSLNGFASASTVAGERGVITAAQNASTRYFARPDADHLRLDSAATRLAGYAGALALAKTSGKHWLGSLTFQTVSPGFEVNDAGFQTRADYRSLSTFLMYRETRAGRRFRNYNVFAFSNHAVNFGGDRIFEGYNLGGNVQLANFWSLGGRVGGSPEVDNDRLTRGGPLASVPAQWSTGLNLRSDSRKRVIGGLNLSYRTDTSGEFDHVVGVTLDARPSSAVRVRLEPQWINEKDTDQFVRSLADTLAQETFGRRYVFADLEQTTVAVGTRVDWTFTPRLSLELFAQPFFVRGDFREYKEFQTPGEYRFRVYGRDGGTAVRNDTTGVLTVDPDGGAGPAAPFQVARGFGERDFALRSVRGNAVLRWEYRPGSVLFFVWQQDRSGLDFTGDFMDARNDGSIFRDPARNIFMVKATYWIGS